MPTGLKKLEHLLLTIERQIMWKQTSMWGHLNVPIRCIWPPVGSLIRCLLSWEGQKRGASEGKEICLKNLSDKK